MSRAAIIVLAVAPLFFGVMMAALGPVIAPSMGTLGAPFACPAGYVGASVKTWRSFDGRNSSDHWELECAMPGGGVVAGSDVASRAALFLGTAIFLGIACGGAALAMTLAKRREQRIAALEREAYEEEERVAAAAPGAQRMRMEQEAMALRREIQNLVTLGAKMPQGSESVARAVAEREARLAELEAKLREQAYPRG
jgi:hypothetical protein